MDKKSAYICTTERLAQLDKAMQSIERGLQAPRPKIQRVDIQLGENPNLAKYYSPRLLSIGPIHHGKENLKHYKLIWTAMYLKENKQNPQDLCQKIEDHIEEVKGLCSEDAIGAYNDNDLVWMLFVDGCSVLQFMQKLDAVHPEELWIKFDQQEHVVMDLFLLENQIPYKVLEILKNDETKLVCSLLNLAFGGLTKFNVMMHDAIAKLSDAGGESWDRILERLSVEHQQGKSKPNHLLDFMRFLCLKTDHDIIQNKRKQETQIQINVGIQVKRNETLGIGLWDVSFVSKWFSGELKLPWLFLDESSPYIYLNTIAYEKCPDFHNNYEVCSYLAYLDTLIDDEKDVKELRLAGVIQNLLGSDEEVARLLNCIGTELPSKEFYLFRTGKMASKEYTQVKYEIEKYCGKKWKTWMAQAYNTHFSNPWSICGFLAAVLALVLTAIQTWPAFRPSH
ncbi:UPF0481 protein [Spatholobus suberectus]|nr:UPF0481 protein [Spatholobus suberectus]